MRDGEAPSILVVDDEEMVAAALCNFLRLETPYRVNAFTSPIDALAHLREAPVHVIIADFMMPEMDGIAFLSAARDCFPAATRILLTGYADTENAIRAINEAGLYYYLEKPWDNEQLKLVIRNGVERSGLFRELDGRMAALEGAHHELAAIRQRLIRAFL